MSEGAIAFAFWLKREQELLEIPLIRFLALLDVNYRTFNTWEKGGAFPFD